MPPPKKRAYDLVLKESLLRYIRETAQRDRFYSLDMTNDSALASLRDVLGEVPQHDRQGYEFSIGDIHVGDTDGAVVEVAAQAVVQASSPVFFRIIDLKPSSGKLVKVSPAAGLTRLQTGDLAIAVHGALAPSWPFAVA